MNFPIMGWAMAIMTGALFALQPGVNAQLAKHLNSPVQAATVSFGVGTLALLLLCWALPHALPSGQQWRSIPFWQLTGGLLGAVAVALSLWLAHRLGAAGLTLALLTGQILMALVLDHFGWIGFEQKPINAARVAGVLMVLGGLILVARH